MPPRRPKAAAAANPSRPEGNSRVTSLQDFKAARHAAQVLEGLLHDPPWLRDVRASAVGGQVQIVVRLLYPTPQARLCTPYRVNSIPVRIEWSGEDLDPDAP
jgi:hypothetical protein